MAVAQRLPRGRHGIPAEVVIANQRQRLVAATASLIAEHGYDELHVGPVTERAGVSRRTFYEFYKDKLECALDSQQQAIESLSGRVLAAGSREREWPVQVALGVAAALDFAAESVDEARLALAPPCAHLEPKFRRNALVADRRMVGLLNESASRYGGGAIERLSGARALGGAIAIISPDLAAGDIHALQVLRPEITRVMLAPYLGEDEALRVARETEAEFGGHASV